MADTVESLRADLLDAAEEMLAANRILPAPAPEHSEPFEAMVAFAKRIRALLNPAPSTAWQHISSDGDSHTFQYRATRHRTTLEGFDTWQEAAKALDERGTPVEAEPVHPTLKAVWGSAKFTHGGEPVQHPPHESAMVEHAPEPLQDAHESIEALRESLETAWEAIELHEAMLRTLRNAVAAAPILKRDLDPVLFALDAIDARKGA